MNETVRWIKYVNTVHSGHTAQAGKKTNKVKTWIIFARTAIAILSKFLLDSHRFKHPLVEIIISTFTCCEIPVFVLTHGHNVSCIDV